MTKTAYYGFTGVIEPSTATRIATAFNHAVNQRCDEIHLCLSSVGGYVADGLYLYNHIRGLPVQVTINNIGTVMSIATAIYASADVRHCSEHGVFMIHPTQIPGLQPNIQAEQLQSALTAALADDQRTEDILRERTDIPDATLTDRRFKDVYITADKAVEFGLAHKVVEFTLPKGNEIIQI